MKKDIPIPKVKDIGVAVVKEKIKAEVVWRVYLINYNSFLLKNVLISSRGYGNINDQKKKTSSFSHFLGDVDKRSFKPFELINEAVFGLSNEFLVTYYIDEVIYDKKYIFLPDSIQEKHFTTIPLLKKKGVLIK
ncbi:MAG: hypothetical protein CMD01_02850 [Flavobacteriales bacterium]|nr:hypothetical protein [Flavobacteriales bacterium]